MNIEPQDWQIIAKCIIVRQAFCSHCGTLHDLPEPGVRYRLAHRSLNRGLVMRADQIPALIPLPQNPTVEHVKYNETVAQCHNCMPERQGEPGGFYEPPQAKPKEKTLDDILDVLDLEDVT